MISPYDYANIRPDIRDALDAWGTGEMPYLGGFLSAVLSNDLKEAVGRADADNIVALPAIVSYSRHKLPAICWGSPAAVHAWAQAADTKRRHAGASE